MAQSRSHHLLFSSMTFTLALWLSLLPLTSGQTVDTRTAILYFDSLYSISFPGDHLEKFLRCLCDNTKKTCRYAYELVTIQNYGAVDDPIFEDTTDSDPSGETFLCHPGGFASEDSVSCVRSPDTSTWCEDQAFCQPMYVTTTDYTACDLSCVSLGWIARSITGRNFSGNPEFLNGFCPSGAATTQATETTTSSTATVSGVQSETSDKVGVLEIDTAIVTFLILLIVILVLIAVGYLVYRSCHQNGASNGILPQSSRTYNFPTRNTAKSIVSLTKRDVELNNKYSNGPTADSSDKTLEVFSPGMFPHPVNPRNKTKSEGNAGDSSKSKIGHQVENNQSPSQIPTTSNSASIAKFSGRKLPPLDKESGERSGLKKARKQEKTKVYENPHEAPNLEGGQWAEPADQNNLAKTSRESDPIDLEEIEKSLTAPSNDQKRDKARAEEMSEEGLAKVSD